MLNIDRKALHEEVYNMPYVKTAYPQDCSSIVKRHNLQVAEFAPDAPETTATVLATSSTTCIICAGPRSDEKGDLIECQGSSRYEECCSSRFHLQCIMKYTANKFNFHYAAMPECANALLCPLHTCGACQTYRKCQSSYQGEFIECALCLQAFHNAEACLPAGYRNILVRMERGGVVLEQDMIICHNHTVYPEGIINTNQCAWCDKKEKRVRGKKVEKMRHCRRCISSFHVTCNELEKVDGLPYDGTLCDYCATGCFSRLDAPVIVQLNGKYEGAHTRDWAKLPRRFRDDKNRQVAGYVPIQMIANKRDWHIVHISFVAKLESFMINIESDAATNNLWQKANEDFIDEAMSRHPPPQKDVRELTNKLIYRISEKERTIFLSQEEAPAKDAPCEEQRRENTECPKGCKNCKNRVLSEGRNIYHANIQVGPTEWKGKGVFATGRIRKGEMIAPYYGELINEAQKNERLAYTEDAKDEEANSYILKVGDGFYVDAARHGNIARYLNHHCEANVTTRVVVVRVTGKDVSGLERIIVMEAAKDIDAGTELCFNYGMLGDLPPQCQCRAEKCFNVLSNASNNKKAAQSKKEREAKAKAKVEPAEEGASSSSTKSTKGRKRPTNSCATQERKKRK